MFDRIIIIVLDGCGIGYLPDAEKFGDVGADTLGNLSKYFNGLDLPNLAKLGLGKLVWINNPPEKIIGCYGKMAEQAPAKNTDAGHWEMMGYVSPGFPIYPKGFPREIIDEFSKRTGFGVIGNYPASGTEIIKELGDEHLKTKKLIVYTSADSVFQVAAHKGVVPPEKLYEICQIAREMLVGDWIVGRVIARPFGTVEGKFKRLNELRKDYAFPPGNTVLEELKKNGLDVIAFGEVESLFCGRGITRFEHTKDNFQGINYIKHQLKTDFTGILFGNLVDTDQVYGHRRNPEGYYCALKEFDAELEHIMELLGELDMLIITADHGNDPTFKGTDHTREYVPLLVYGKNIKNNLDLGVRDSFADVAKTISENFNIKINRGKSFLENVRRTDLGG